MPGNEMIHIQEGYLRLHFNISKQQHVIFTLKPLFPRNKGVWSGAQKSASPLSDWLVEGKPSGVPDPFRLWGWPPPPLHRTLIQTRAGFALISSPQSSCQSENRGGAWTPCFGSNARLIKPTVLVSHDGGEREETFSTPCSRLSANVTPQLSEGAILICRTCDFRSGPVAFTNLAPLWCFLPRWHCCVWQKACGSVRKLY